MAASFDWVMENDIAGFIVSPGCLTEIQGYFTNQRVDRSTVPEGWYAYDLRTTENGTLCTVEERVVVNHGGTFLTKRRLKLNDKGVHNLKGRGGYTFSDEIELVV